MGREGELEREAVKQGIGWVRLGKVMQGHTKRDKAKDNYAKGR